MTLSSSRSMRRRRAAGASLTAAALRVNALLTAIAVIAAAALTACARPKGELMGEFQDQGLYEAALKADPTLAAWSVQEHIDGSSGATIQAKTFGAPVPDRTVLVDGKIVAYADGFGQFLVELPAGKHTLTGRCEGYEDAAVEVKVKAGNRAYLTFFLRAD